MALCGGHDKTRSRRGVNAGRLGISIKGLAFRINGFESTTIVDSLTENMALP